MSAIRNFIWNYPASVVKFVHAFSLFFKILSGVIVGVILFLFLHQFFTQRLSVAVFDKVLKVGSIGYIESYNPLDISAPNSEKLLTQLLFNSLVTIDDSGRTNPELANAWEISPDGRTYTFFLKKNIKWHDGQELTAQDVLTTFTLLQSGDKETVLGAMVNDLEIKIVDVYTISFHLPQVNAAFLELMTTPIVANHVYKGFSYARLVEQGDTVLPVGTGPFMFVSQKGHVVTLVRNNNYFSKWPNIKTIHIHTYQSFDEAQKDFLKGKLTMLTGIDTANGGILKDALSSSPHIKMSKVTQKNNTRVVFFNIHPTAENLHNIPVDDVAFRQAVVQAVNKDEVVSQVDASSVAFGPYDASSYIYDKNVESILPFNSKESNASFEKLGWTYPYSGAPFRMKQDNELQLTLTFLDTPINHRVSALLKEQFAKSGINLSLRGVSSEVLQQQVLPEKDFELLLFEVSTGIDPDQYGLWHSSQTVFPGLNLGSFAVSAIDTQLEKGRLQVNRDKRIEIYKEFQKQLVKQAPVIFLYHPAYYEAYFDIIERKSVTAVVAPADSFESIQEWKLLTTFK